LEERVHVLEGKEISLGKVIFKSPEDVILCFGNKLTDTEAYDPITVGVAMRSAVCISPKVETYWIPVFLEAMLNPSISVKMMVILSVGLVLRGFSILIN
jgi:hypothetical protein